MDSNNLKEELYPRTNTWTGVMPSRDSLVNQRPSNRDSADLPRITSWTGLSSRSSFTSTISSFIPNIPVNITTTKNVWQPPDVHHRVSLSKSSAGSDLLKQLQKDQIENYSNDLKIENKSSNGTKSSKHREENWHELFYDLIFVAAAIQIGTILKAEISTQNVIQSSILFLILRSTWDNLMLYQNRFDTSDLLHYAFYLIQAIAAFVMTINLTLESDSTRWDSRTRLPSFSIAACVSRLVLCLMYVHVIRFSHQWRKGFRKYLILLAFSQFLSGLMFLFTAVLSRTLQYDRSFELIWISTIILERPFVTTCTAIYQRLKNKPSRMGVHFEHMVRRQGVFILLISGEAIIQIVQSVDGYSVDDYLRGCLGFTIIYGVGICYYEQQRVCLANPYAVETTTLGYLWEALHVFLSLSIMFFAVGVKLSYSSIHRTDDSDDGTSSQEYLMTISASVSLVIIFLLRIIHKGLYMNIFRLEQDQVHKIFKSTRLFAYFLRFIISIVISFLPAMTKGTDQTVYVLTSLVVLLVLMDTVQLSAKYQQPSRAEEMGLLVSRLRSQSHRSGIGQSVDQSPSNTNDNSNSNYSFGGGSFSFVPDFLKQSEDNKILDDEEAAIENTINGQEENRLTFSQT